MATPNQDGANTPSAHYQKETGEHSDHSSSGYRTPQPPLDTEKQTPAALETPQPVRPERTLFKWVFICLAMYMSAFLYGLDNTIVADVQAPIVEKFHSVDKLAWLGIGFPLGSIASIMPLGKAFGIFDVKWIYVASQVMFAAGSALCGGAPNMNALIVGRVWAGAGGAGMYLGVLNLITIYTNDTERAMYNALCGFTWGAGSILGPVIGGAFADSSATWRWAFYINLILFAVSSPVYFFLLDSYQPQPGKTLGQKLKDMDWIGTVLNAGLFGVFVILFTFAGPQWPWDSGRTIACFVILGLLLILFPLQQAYAWGTTVENRIFPIDFVRDRTMVLFYILTSAPAAAAFICIYYIPLFFAFTQGSGGVQSAVHLLPFVCVLIFTCMLNGGLMPVFKYYYPWYIVSGVLSLAGGAGMYATLDRHTSNSTIYGLSILIACSGLTMQAAYSLAPAKVPPHRTADAISFINAAQIGSIVIGLTISGSIFQNLGYKHVADALRSTGVTGFDPADIRTALSGAKSALFVTADEQTRAAILDGIVKTIDDNFILAMTSGAVVLFCSFFLKREKLFIEMGAGGG